MKITYDNAEYTTEKKDCLDEKGMRNDVKLLSEAELLWAKILIALTGK